MREVIQDRRWRTDAIRRFIGGGSMCEWEIGVSAARSVDEERVMWARFDSRLSDSPMVLGVSRHLGRRDGPFIALGALTTALLWSHHYATGGFLPDAVAKWLFRRPPILQAFVDAGVLKQVENGYQLQDDEGNEYWEIDDEQSREAQKRRARQSISAHLRFAVFERDDFTCRYCGRRPPDVVLCLDHVHPVAAGGKDEIRNLVTACMDCNAGKSDRLLKASTTEPTTPVLRFENKK